ncbi:MAG: hypothetical protein OEW12_04255 [Deltaproteobacteria bacterium]|nr:hypothetical protein [Deltaproteobacteria bacterium]
MAKKDNVISLEGRLAERKQKEQAGTPQPLKPTLTPIPARLVWLHCPACDTTEYTELAVEGGRTHKCGALVEEAVVEIDLRAELTLASANLDRIEALRIYLDNTFKHFDEYRKRLLLMCSEPPPLYPVNPDTLKSMPVVEVDPFGMMISDALSNPRRRFGKSDEDK